jgi:hypothetical protein
MSPAMGWLCSLVECVICSHQWAAVRPADAGDHLECPNCSYHGDVVNIDEHKPHQARDGWDHGPDGEPTGRIT